MRPSVALVLVAALSLGCVDTPEQRAQPVADARGQDVMRATETASEVTRLAACGEFDDGVYGDKHPWRGFEHEGVLYTCNTCRGGIEALQGSWRVLDFATEDPEVALADDWRQTFTFDGNTWRQVATWREGDTERTATIEGWYWCSSKPEVHNEAKVFVFTTLAPEDAFGYAPGAVLTADLLQSTEGGDKLAFMFYEGFNVGDQLAEVYCRVGSTVTTLAGEVKPCASPFD